MSEIKERYPSVETLCSKEEASYITGKSKSLRLRQAEAIQDSLPEGEKEGGKAFQAFIASIKSVDNVTEINCGDTFSWCGGVDVVDTKGHMPGHISLYVRNEKTLIAGDALVVENGKLCMAMPQFLLNAQDAQESVKRLMRYARENCFGVLIIFGKDERAKFEASRRQYSDAIQRIYDDAETYHDGKWMMAYMDDSSLLHEVMRLLAIKRKPNRK